MAVTVLFVRKMLGAMKFRDENSQFDRKKWKNLILALVWRRWTGLHIDVACVFG